MGSQFQKQIYINAKKSGYSYESLVKNALKGLSVFFIITGFIFVVNVIISTVCNKNIWDEKFWINFLISDLVIGIFINLFELCLSFLIWSKNGFKNLARLPRIFGLFIAAILVYMLLCLSMYIIYKICCGFSANISFSGWFLIFIIFGGAVFNSILHALLYR